ncbi:MAG: hypothetical protein KGO96_01315 [Elusimicrobia bacterium]|nr:hypothetical protein [Elusimicrobiota bacterium]MDE2424534.1 hypothetical protein [Elusimicrobiota bacterium]
MSCLAALLLGIATTLSARSFSKPYIDLLARNHFSVRADGSIWPDGAKNPVDPADVPYLIHRLESGQRLQALLRLDILLSKSDGERYLTPDERDELRRIVRETWPFFTLGARKDFAHFFSLEELEQMNRDPAPLDTATALTMTDPAPAALSSEDVPPALKPVPTPHLLSRLPPPQAPQTQQSAPSAPTVYYIASLPLAPAAPTAPAAALPPAAVLPLVVPRALPAVSPAAPPAIAAATPAAASPKPQPAAVAAVAAAAPLRVAAPAAAVAPKPASSAIATLGAPVSTSTIAVSSLPTAATPAAAYAAAAEGLPPPVAAAAALGAGPPTKVAETPQPPSVPAPAAAPVLPPQPVAEAGLPPVKTVSQSDFETFLRDAPYGNETKNLLRLISLKAFEPARSRALDVLMNDLPQIVIDSQRVGLDAHAALLAIETPTLRAYTIALSPGPAIYAKKHFFESGPAVLLSDSAKIYASLHVPMPTLEALKPDAVAVKEELGPWDRERVFSDGSRRGSYSPQEQAGYLLRKLLRLAAKRQGWDASAYVAEAYARSAQWAFYSRAISDQSLLDPETRDEFDQWRDQPDEYRDHLVHTLSAGRVQTLDPRKGNALTQRQFDRAALQDCVATFKADLAARLDADRDAMEKDALALERGELIDKDQLERSRQAIAADFEKVRPPRVTPAQCDARYGAEAAELGASAAVFAEMSQSERDARAAMGQTQ